MINKTFLFRFFFTEDIFISWNSMFIEFWAARWSKTCSVAVLYPKKKTCSVAFVQIQSGECHVWYVPPTPTSFSPPSPSVPYLLYRKQSKILTSQKKKLMSLFTSRNPINLIFSLSWSHITVCPLKNSTASLADRESEREFVLLRSFVS